MFKLIIAVLVGIIIGVSYMGINSGSTATSPFLEELASQNVGVMPPVTMKKYRDTQTNSLVYTIDTNNGVGIFVVRP